MKNIAGEVKGNSITIESENPGEKNRIVFVGTHPDNDAFFNAQQKVLAILLKSRHTPEAISTAKSAKEIFSPHLDLMRMVWVVQSDAGTNSYIDIKNKE